MPFSGSLQDLLMDASKIMILMLPGSFPFNQDTEFVSIAGVHSHERKANQLLQLCMEMKHECGLKGLN